MAAVAQAQPTTSEPVGSARTPSSSSSRSGGPNDASPDPKGRRARRIGLAIAITAVVAGSSWRFVTADHVSTPLTPVATVAPTSAEGLARLETAAQAKPGDPGRWAALGTAYTHKAIETSDPAYTALATKAFDRADAAAGPAGDFRSFTGRGALELNLHRFADALVSGQRAHALAPDNADSLAVIVDAQVELGRYDEAAGSLQAVLDRKPNLAALSRASYLRELHGDTEGAVVAMRQAEAAGQPGTFAVATVIALEGDLAFAQGNLAEAGAQYDRSLLAAPGLIGARMGRARVLAATGQRQEAIGQLEELTATIPQPAAVALLGDLQSASGQTAAAEKSYGLVRTISKLQQASGAVTDLELALFEADRGSAPVALDLAQKAYAERPSIYGADALAWALHRSGRDADALPLVAQSLRLGSADALLHYHAAAVYAAAGPDQRNRAISELTATFATNPNFSFALAGEAVALAHRLGVSVPAVLEGSL